MGSMCSRRVCKAKVKWNLRQFRQSRLPTIAEVCDIVNCHGVVLSAMRALPHCGDMSQQIVPIKRASHGRKLQSVFRRGLVLLRGWLLGTGGVFCCMFEKMVSVFSDAAAFGNARIAAVSSALSADP